LDYREAYHLDITQVSAIPETCVICLASKKNPKIVKLCDKDWVNRNHTSPRLSRIEVRYSSLPSFSGCGKIMDRHPIMNPAKSEIAPTGAGQE